MPSKYSPWLEMQSFSWCIHFLKASRYADFGTVIRYWWMADPSACRDWYFRPARNAFNFGNKKKSHGARSGEYGGWGKTVTFSFFKNAVTRARENRKNSRSGPKLRILDRFQTPQNANKSVQHFPNQPIFTNQWCLKNHKRSSLSKLTTSTHLLNAILW